MLFGGEPTLIPSTWNPSDKGGDVTLSNGNLTAKSSNTDTWIDGVRTIASNTTGKFYFELLGLGSSGFLGFATSAWNLGPSRLPDATGTISYDDTNGQIRQNTSGGGNVLVITAAAAAHLSTFCIAIDLTSNLIWIRVNAGNWNNSASANPETGTGGGAITSMGATYVAIDCIGSNGRGYTANFGASTFTYVVPSGFKSGWGS